MDTKGFGTHIGDQAEGGGGGGGGSKCKLFYFRGFGMSLTLRIPRVLVPTLETGWWGGGSKCILFYFRGFGMSLTLRIPRVLVPTLETGWWGMGVNVYYFTLGVLECLNLSDTKGFGTNIGDWAGGGGGNKCKLFYSSKHILFYFRGFGMSLTLRIPRVLVPTLESGGHDSLALGALNYAE